MSTMPKTKKTQSGYYIYVNGEPRKVDAMWMGHNGQAYKFIGMKSEKIDGNTRRVAVFTSKTDSRNASAEEMQEYEEMKYMPSYIQFI